MNLFSQRDARGSITFKIVPSYRSAPPPCEVNLYFITYMTTTHHITHLLTHNVFY